MDKNEVLKKLNEIANFNFDIDFMNNVFDYNVAWNKLENHDQILITREHYRKPLKLFIEGKVSSERLRAWVYYMDQTMAFTTNLDLDGEDDDVLLNIRDQISATIIDGPLTVEIAKSFLSQIKDDWEKLVPG